MKKALFAISSLGLGHASRSTAVVNEFKKEYEITIVSFGNALDFLKEEFKDEEIITFLSYEDYPLLERGNGFYFYYYLFIDLIKTNIIINRERDFVNSIEDEYDFIYSDGRYGFCSAKIPSFLLSHQISFMPPKWLGAFKWITDFSNFFYFKRFNTIFIPDYKNIRNSLAGKLSHNILLKFLRYKYIGVLSSYTKLPLKEDIDYLFVISGYLKDKKENFTLKLLDEAKKLDGKKVFILGDTSSNEIQILDNDTTIYPSVTKEIKNELFNRAKVVISRTGYTTIMDLVELDKKAVLFPTLNSTEQEYLARYYKHSNHFIICEDAKNFDLKELTKKLDNLKPLREKTKTKDALALIKKTINAQFKKQFFSIIIPAYNEEKYIKNTLQHLEGLDYHKDDFEIIVVENGSDDDTFAVAKGFENKMTNLKVYKTTKGVSKARNEGLLNVNDKSEFCLFLDADTYLKRDFLKELNNYINAHSNENIIIGTTTIKPENGSFYDKLWFKIYDIGHFLTKTSFSFQIAKTSFAKKIKYDESLNYSEDNEFIKEMLIYGNFFFIHTKGVVSSPRRFRQNGYFKTTFKWIYEALMPYNKRRYKSYESVR